MTQACSVESAVWGRADALAVLRLMGSDPQQVDVWNAYRDRNPDWTPELSSIDEPIDLKGLALPASAEGAGLNLRRINLSGADLTDAKLSGVDLTEADLTDAKLCGAQLWNINLQSAFLIGADLTGAKLSSANLINANLTGGNLTGADLSESSMAGAELWGAILTDAQVWGADLSRAKLTSANLNRAKLRSANLSLASLEDASLIGTDLAFANIIATELSYADLTDARLGGVRYARSKMSGKCRGIRVSNCFGNALFKRDAQDQDFIDTFRAKILDDLQRQGQKCPLRRFRWRILLNKKRILSYLKIKLMQIERHVALKVMPAVFRAWGWIDYGRSMTRVGRHRIAGRAWVWGHLPVV